MVAGLHSGTARATSDKKESMYPGQIAWPLSGRVGQARVSRALWTARGVSLRLSPSLYSVSRMMTTQDVQVIPRNHGGIARTTLCDLLPRAEAEPVSQVSLGCSRAKVTRVRRRAA